MHTETSLLEYTRAEETARRLWRWPLILGLALAASGCSVGPHLKAPRLAPSSGYTSTGVQRDLNRQPKTGVLTWTAANEAAWWRMFHSAPLDRLIAESFRQNPSLDAARHALAASQQYEAAQEGEFFPNVSLGGGLQRNTSLRSVIGGRVVVPGKPFTLASGSLQLSYNTNVFGLETDIYRTAKARAAVSAAQLDEAKIFLAGNVATAAVSLAGYQAELDLRRRIVNEEQKILAVMRNDYRLGSITEESVEQQEAVLAASRAQLPLLAAQRDNFRHQLDYLIGEPPTYAVPQLQINSFSLPRTIPVIIPSSLVENRPDIQAAMASMKAASAQVDASTAAMYPNINLSAAFGAGSPVALFNPASEIWSLASTFAAPLFEGGRLSAEKSAAYALWQQTTSQYRDTVLKAFRQVADSLRTLQGDQASLQQKQEAAAFAMSALKLARERYGAGAITYQTLLTAELEAQDDQVAALVQEVACYTDIVTLFIAMGDGTRSVAGAPQPASL